ncbi:MAG: DNA mismatch repair protein MutS [Firmicutes bacterium]|nr:DNA mismatch repair protein MutS [Bacillota bacterium]
MGYTPMMQQYLKTKEQYKDCILFYRLGDFYEMFFEDALTASKVMEVTLTGKNCGMEERAPMCGVPYHAADTYIAKLTEKGYNVAICEQMEDPATAKGLVKREVIRIVTPGTQTSPLTLSEGENNYLACLRLSESCAGLAYCDLSTGEIRCGEFRGPSFREDLISELVKIRAKEILHDPQILPEEKEEIGASAEGFLRGIEERYFDAAPCRDVILRQFGVMDLRGIGLAELPEGVRALGALLQYLFETQKQSLSHLVRLDVMDLGDHMSLDKATLKNLELTETLFDKKTQGSLLGVLDKTGTAMGARKMKQWLKEPLNQAGPIQNRLDAVEYLYDEYLCRNDLREELRAIYDLERLCGRIAVGNANGRDVIALKKSLEALPAVLNEITGTGVRLFDELAGEIADFSRETGLIGRAIVEEPPFTIKEGGIIRPGYSEELDLLKDSIRDGQQWIASLEGTERERTGIKNLKVGFNKVFGYYIEVTKSNYELVPENYIRKQTLVNCERFITPELKEVESVVLGAETRINQMEYELFLEVRRTLQESIPAIQKASSAVASLDVLCSFAEVSSRNDYVKPRIREDDVITIEKGRHPVIEQSMGGETFVSNDLFIDRKDSSLLLITGPNMAGKSTYMRQNALIVLMAQAGCFVPCERAVIGIVDRIYTRIGASDNLAQGQSTFFVEMNELAGILNTCTSRSLILLDEVGRGTSTYDGLSIAWALAEYLCREKNQVRTLFATHYHELTVLEGQLPGFKNLNVEVLEEGGSVVFLHKIVEGSASRSYGIHVARIAGVPKALLESAQMKLDELEQGQPLSLPAVNKETKADEPPQPEQISFFGYAPDPIIEEIRQIDIMNITPSQAFRILEKLREAVEKED